MRSFDIVCVWCGVVGGVAVVMKEDRAEFRSLCLWFKSGDHTRVDEWSGRLVCGGGCSRGSTLAGCGVG